MRPPLETGNSVGDLVVETLPCQVSWRDDSLPFYTPPRESAENAGF